MLLLEITGPESRAFFSVFLSLTYSTGALMFLGMAYFVRAWRYLALISALSAGSLYLAVFWFFPESRKDFGFLFCDWIEGVVTLGMTSSQLGGFSVAGNTPISRYARRASRRPTVLLQGPGCVFQRVSSSPWRCFFSFFIHHWGVCSSFIHHRDFFFFLFVDFFVKSRQDQRETDAGRVRRRSPGDAEERRQGGPLQGPLRHWSLSDSEYAEENVDFGVFECLQ